MLRTSMDRGLVYPAVGTNSPSHQSFGRGRSGRGGRNSQSGVAVCDDVTSDENRPRNAPVYLAVCLFAIGGTLPTRAIWIELPTLSKKLPESQMLSLYLLIILESANLAALGYLLTKRFASNRLSEIPFIYSCFGLGLLSLILAAFFWDHTTLILGQQNSFALLLSGFFAAIVYCVSTVTFYPFTSRLRQKYVTAFFLGETFGSTLPQLLSVAQGINGKLTCSKEETIAAAKAMLMVNPNGTIDSETQPEGSPKETALSQQDPYVYYQPKGTLDPGPQPMPLRFDEQTYFLVCAALLGLSLLCFVLLRWCSVCRFEYSQTVADTVADMDNTSVEVRVGSSLGVSATSMARDMEEEIWQPSYDGIRTLDDGSIRHPGTTNKSGRLQPNDKFHGNLDSSGSHTSHSPKPTGMNNMMYIEDINSRYDRPRPLVGGHNELSTTPTYAMQSQSNVNKTSSHGNTKQHSLRWNSQESIRSASQQGAQRKVPPLLSRTRLSTASDITHVSTDHVSSSEMPRSFPLLLVITFWTTAVLFGPLSPNKAYSCLPTGNIAFLIGTLLSDVFVIITCLVAAKNTNRAQITLVIALTCLGTILLTYFVALMAFSHQSDTGDEPPLYGSAGEMLAAIAWTVITALFSYARVTIGVLSRQASQRAVTWYSYVTLFGASVGTLSFMGGIGICRVFREMTCKIKTS